MENIKAGTVDDEEFRYIIQDLSSVRFNTEYLLNYFSNTKQGEFHEIPPSKYRQELSMTSNERNTMLTKTLKNRPLTHEFVIPPEYSVVPSTIVFQSWEPGHCYSLKFSLINITMKPREVKMLSPESDVFNVSSKASVLQMKHLASKYPFPFLVTFVPKDRIDYQHVVTFVDKDYHFKIPILAITQRPMISCPDEIVLHDSPVGAEEMKSVTIQNTSSVEAIGRLVAELPFRVEPTKFSLNHGKSITLNVYFNTSELGPCSRKLYIYFEGGEVLTVNLKGQTCLCDVKLHERLIDFCGIYLNLKSSRKVCIENKSKFTINFKWKQYPSRKIEEYEIGIAVQTYTDIIENKKQFPISNDHDIVTDRLYRDGVTFAAQEILYFTDKNFEIIPLSGKIGPHASQLCSVIFSPDIIGDYKNKAFLEVEGLKEVLSVTLKGEGIGPSIELLSYVLEIKNAFITQKHNYEISVGNYGDVPGTIVYKGSDRDIQCVPKSIHLIPGEISIFTITISFELIEHILNDLLFEIVESKKELKCLVIGDVKLVDLKFQDEILDFGTVVFGIEKTITATVVNKGTFPVDFTLQVENDGTSQPLTANHFIFETSILSFPENPRQFFIHPSNGSLEASETMEIQVTIIPNTYRRSDCNLVLYGQHKLYRINNVDITYTVEEPIIYAFPDEFPPRTFLIYTENKYKVEMYNPSELNITYRLKAIFRKSTGNAILEPNSGFLNASKKIFVTITIVPESLGNGLVDIVAFLLGRELSILVCRISWITSPPYINVTPMWLRWKSIESCENLNKKLVLTNPSYVDLGFTISVENPSFWSIEPKEGVICANESLEVVVTPLLFDIGKFNYKLTLKFTHETKDIEIPLTGFACICNTIIFQPQIHPHWDMGAIFRDYKQVLPLTVTNVGVKEYNLSFITDSKLPLKMHKGVFKIKPNQIDLKPGQQEVIKVTAFSEHAVTIEEKFYVYTIVFMQGKKILLFPVTFKVRVYDMDLIVRPRNLSFRLNYPQFDCDFNKYEKIIKLGTYSNLMSSVVCTLRDSHFWMLNDQNEKVQELEVPVHEGEFYSLRIHCSPDKKTVTYSQTLTAKMFIAEKTFKFNVAVNLEAIVIYAHFSIKDRILDFGCVSPRRDSHWALVVRNNCNFPLFFSWKWETLDVIPFIFTKLHTSMLTKIRKSYAQMIEEIRSNSELKIRTSISRASQSSFGNIPNILSTKEEVTRGSVVKGNKKKKKATKTVNKKTLTASFEKNLSESKYRTIRKLIDVLFEPDNRPWYTRRRLMVAILYPFISKFKCHSAKCYSLLPASPPDDSSTDILTINPMFGYVPPKESCVFDVYFMPPVPLDLSGVASSIRINGYKDVIEIAGGCRDEINLEVPEIFDFGYGPYCELWEGKIILINHEDFWISFDLCFESELHEYLILDKPGKCFFSPLKGVIYPEQRMEISVKVFPGKPMDISHNVRIIVCETFDFRVQVVGKAISLGLSVSLPTEDPYLFPNEQFYIGITKLAKESLEKCRSEEASLISHIKGICLTDPDTINWEFVQYEDVPTLEEIDIANQASLGALYASRFPCWVINHALEKTKQTHLHKFRTIGFILDFEYTLMDFGSKRIISFKNNCKIPIKFSVDVLRDKYELRRLGFKFICDFNTLNVGESKNIKISLFPKMKKLSSYLKNYTIPVEIVIEVKIICGPIIPITIKSFISIPYLVLPEYVDFGTLKCGQRKIMKLTVTNEGAAPAIWVAKITNIYRKETHNNKQSIITKEQGEPFWLIHSQQIQSPPKTKKVIEIAFEPKNQGIYKGEVDFLIDLNTDRFMVKLKAKAIEPRVNIDFTDLDFGRVVPFQDVFEKTITLTNPCPYSIEVFSPLVDKQFQREEMIKKQVLRYYKTDKLHVPIDFYDSSMGPNFLKLYNMLIDTARDFFEYSRGESIDDLEDDLLVEEFLQVLENDHSIKTKDLLNTFLSRLEGSLMNFDKSSLIVVIGAPKTDYVRLVNKMARKINMVAKSLDNLIIEETALSSAPEAVKLRGLINRAYLSLLSKNPSFVMPPGLTGPDLEDENYANLEDWEKIEIVRVKIEILSQNQSAPMRESYAKNKPKTKPKSPPSPNKDGENIYTQSFAPASSNWRESTLLGIPMELFTNLIKNKVRLLAATTGLVVDQLIGLFVKDLMTGTKIFTKIGQPMPKMHFLIIYNTFEADKEQKTLIKLKKYQAKKKYTTMKYEEITSMETDKFLECDYEDSRNYLAELTRRFRICHGMVPFPKSSSPGPFSLISKKPASAKTSKKPAGRKSVARKSVARKSVARKSVSRKSVSRKSVSRKSVSRKSVSRKSVSRKSVSRKSVSRKSIASSGKKGGSSKKSSAPKEQEKDEIAKEFEDFDYQLMEVYEYLGILMKKANPLVCPVSVKKKRKRFSPTDHLTDAGHGRIENRIMTWIITHPWISDNAALENLCMNLAQNTTFLEQIDLDHAVHSKEPKISMFYCVEPSKHFHVPQDEHPFSVHVIDNDSYIYCSHIHKTPSRFDPKGELVNYDLARVHLKPGQQTQLKVIFQPKECKRYNDEFELMIGGWPLSRQIIKCHAICDIPSINEDCEVIFNDVCGNRKNYIKTGPVYEKSLRQLNFGPTFVYNDTYTQSPFLHPVALKLYNVSELPASIYLSFVSQDNSPFGLGCTELKIEPEEYGTLIVYARPFHVGNYSDELIVSIKNNPAIFKIKMVGEGIKPDIEFTPSPAPISLEDVLIYDNKMDHITIKNRCKLPISWELENYNTINDITWAKKEGDLKTNEKDATSVTYSPTREESKKDFAVFKICKWKQKINVVCKMKIPMIISSCNINVDIHCGEDGSDTLNFGSIWVGKEKESWFTISNTGKSLLRFKIRFAAATKKDLFEPSKVLKLAVKKGKLLQGSVVKVSVTACSLFALTFSKVCVLFVQILFKDADQIVAEIPIYANLDVGYSKYLISPFTEYNFGPTELFQKKLYLLTISNTGSFPFDYFFKGKAQEPITMEESVRIKKIMESMNDSDSIKWEIITPKMHETKKRTRAKKSTIRDSAPTRPKSVAPKKSAVEPPTEASKDQLTDQCNLENFELSQFQGKLLPGESAHVEITFHPMEEGHIIEVLEVHVDSAEHVFKMTPVKLQGEGCLPKISTLSRVMFQHLHLTSDENDLNTLRAFGTPFVAYNTVNHKVEFHNTIVGCSHDAYIELDNSGLISARVKGNIYNSYENAFTFENNSTHKMITVEASTFQKILIKFSPKTVNLSEAILNFTLALTQPLRDVECNIKLIGSGNIPQVVFPAFVNDPEPTLNLGGAIVGTGVGSNFAFKNVGKVIAKVMMEFIIESGTFNLRIAKNANQLLKHPAIKDSKSLQEPIVFTMPIGELIELTVEYIPSEEREDFCHTVLHVIHNPYEKLDLLIRGIGIQKALTIDNLPLFTFLRDSSSTVNSRINSKSEAYTYDLSFEPCGLGLVKKNKIRLKNNKNEPIRLVMPTHPDIIFVPTVAHIEGNSTFDLHVIFLGNTEGVFEDIVSLKYRPIAVNEDVAIKNWAKEKKFSEIISQNRADSVPNFKKFVSEISVGSEPKFSNIDKEKEQNIQLYVNTQCSILQMEIYVRDINFPPTIMLESNYAVIIFKNTGLVPIKFHLDVAEGDQIPWEPSPNWNCSIGENGMEYLPQYKEVFSPILGLDPSEEIETQERIIYPKHLSESKKITKEALDINLKLCHDQEYETEEEYAYESQMYLRIDKNLDEEEENHSESAATQSTVVVAKPVAYSVVIPDTAFSVEPSSGIIKPNRYAIARVKFSPHFVYDYTSKIICRASYINYEEASETIGEIYLYGTGLSSICHILHKEAIVDGIEKYPESTRVIEILTYGVGKTFVKKFSLMNPTKFPYKFYWKRVYGEEDMKILFTCNVTFGDVLPFWFHEITFNFMPRDYGTYHSLWMLQIPSFSVNQPILFVGKSMQPNVYFSPPVVKMTPGPVDIERYGEVVLVNEEDFQVDFSVDDKSLKCVSQGQTLQVTPTEGKINGKSKYIIRVSLKSSIPGDLKFEVKVKVSRCKDPLTLYIEGKYYNLDCTIIYLVNENQNKLHTMKTNYFEIGYIPIKVPFRMEFLMVNYSDRLLTFKWDYDITKAKDMALVINFDPQTFLGSQSKSKLVHTILPMKIISIVDFPISLKTDTGSEYIILINGTATKPAFDFSFKNFNFGPCLVQHSDLRVNRTVLKFSNKSKEQLLIEKVTQEKGHLKVSLFQHIIPPKGSVDIIIEFLPRKAIKYNTVLDFLINGVYPAKVEIEGEGVMMAVGPANPAGTVVKIEDVLVGTSQTRTRQIVNFSIIPLQLAMVVEGDRSIRIDPSDIFTMKPNETKIVSITYTPITKETISSQVMIKTIEDVQPLFDITCSSLHSLVDFDVSVITFGTVVKGCKVSQNITIINNGDTGHSFKWDCHKMNPNLKISPMEGSCFPGSKISCKISFQCLTPGYKFNDEILCNIENYKSLPLRVYVECINTPEPQKWTSFSVPVRQNVIQNVPIENHSMDTVIVYPVITGQYFTVDEAVIIQPKSAAFCAVKYEPLTMTENYHEGRLFLQFPCGTCIVQGLKGESTKPDSEGEITWQIEAKTYDTKFFQVKNWLQEHQRFDISIHTKSEDFPPYSFSGASSIDVAANSSRMYPMTIYISKDCNFEFDLSFINSKTGEYLWYNGMAKVRTTGPIETRILSAQVRTIVTSEIELFNPSDETQEIHLDSESSELTILNSSLEKDSTTKVIFQYSPLIVSEDKRVNIRLKNKKLGDFWYVFKLSASPAKRQNPIMFESPLGMAQTLIVVINNKAHLRAKFKVKLTDTELKAKKRFDVDAQSSYNLEVTYTPLSLGTKQGEMLVTSSDAGDYLYPVQMVCTPIKPTGPYILKPGGKKIIKFHNLFNMRSEFISSCNDPAFSVSPENFELGPKKKMDIEVTMAEKDDISEDIDQMFPIAGKLTIFWKEDENIKWDYYLRGIINEIDSPDKSKIRMKSSSK